MARRKSAEPIDLSGGDSGITQPIDGPANENVGDNLAGVEATAAEGQSAATVSDNGNEGAAGGDGRKRRSDAGKRRGPRGKTNQEGLDLGVIQFALLSIHSMLASVTKSPEWILPPEEAQQFADAAKRLQSFYPSAISEKHMAWITFSTVGGMIYVPRMIAIGRRRSEERAMQRPKQPIPPQGNSHAMPPQPANQQRQRPPQNESMLRPSDLNTPFEEN